MGVRVTTYDYDSEGNRSTATEDFPPADSWIITCPPHSSPYVEIIVDQGTDDERVIAVRTNFDSLDAYETEDDDEED